MGRENDDNLTRTLRVGHLPVEKPLLSLHFQKHEVQREQTSPLKEAFTENFKETLQAVLVASSYDCLFYVALVFLPNWLEEYVHFPLDRAMT